MNIGIVIAVPQELSSFLQSKFTLSIETVKNRTVYKFEMNKNNVYVTTSGYGKIDAASATQFLITKYDCETIINYGVTGALIEELKVQDLFIIKSAINYDFDITPIEKVKPHQYLGFEDEHIPLNKDLINLVKSMYPNIKEAIVASGDKFIENLDEKNSMAKTLNCNICDMEVSGIAKTCLANNVKCLSIKCISDTLYGNGQDFHKNVENSAKKAFNLIEKLLLVL